MTTPCPDLRLPGANEFCDVLNYTRFRPNQIAGQTEKKTIVTTTEAEEIVVQDVLENGLAASIEFYLGADILRLGNQTLTPVQWKGYSDTLQQYQGEVRKKAELHGAFSRRLARCRTNPAALEETDWSGLSAILRMVFRVFD